MMISTALALENHFIKIGSKTQMKGFIHALGVFFSWEILGIMAGSVLPMGKDFGFAFFSAKFSQSTKLVGLE